MQWSTLLPIYEYECLESKHRFDRYQSFSEAAVTTCPECGSTVRKVLQPVGLVFKGSGWYKTDSRNATAAGKADVAKDSGDSASTEAKPAGDAKGDSSTKAESSGDGASSKPDGGKKAESGAKADSGSKPAPAAASSNG